MIISARGEYALKAMLDLALHDGESLTPIQEIASRRRIPQRYLEQVLLQLKRAGLLQSKRGSAGGYRLRRPAAEVTVGRILRAVEGGGTGLDGSARGLRGVEPAREDELAALRRAIAEALSGVVDRLTLEDLRREAAEREDRDRAMYHI